MGHHDLGWWAFIISIVALVAAYPLSLLANLTTPFIVTWFVRWSRSSLEDRIAGLERTLQDLEKEPPIDEVQDQTLWEIKHAKITVLGGVSSVVIVIYFALKAIPGISVDGLHVCAFFVFTTLGFNMVVMLKQRYERDFRFRRSPTVRRDLRKAIENLKNLRETRATRG
jgi:hypothetical protein